MVIGVPKEVKDHETRVGCVPSMVTALRESGHEVLVETGAGIGSSIPTRNTKKPERSFWKMSARCGVSPISSSK